MPLRALTAAASAVVLSLVIAGSASSHHEGTVSVTSGPLAIDPPRCAMYERRPASRCDGSRRATVSFSAACGATASVSAQFLASRKGGGKPIYLDGDSAPAGQLSGAISGIVPAGARVYAVVTIECTWEDPEGTGPEAHTVTRSANASAVVVPPWLQEVSVQKGNYCNFNPGSRTVLQAGQRGSILSYSTDFVEKSLLGAGRRTKAGVRQRWLGARGAGIRLRRHPEVFLLQEFGRREPFSGLLRPNPRRAGWLKVWEEVGGVRSNTLAIKVVPNRC